MSRGVRKQTLARLWLPPLHSQRPVPARPGLPPTCPLRPVPRSSGTLEPKQTGPASLPTPVEGPVSLPLPESEALKSAQSPPPFPLQSALGGLASTSSGPRTPPSVAAALGLSPPACSNPPLSSEPRDASKLPHRPRVFLRQHILHSGQDGPKMLP